MGCLRLFLALVVVVAHTLPAGRLPIIGGALAVKLFFVVSGFYMALILSEKYNQPGVNGTRLFYSNRALRIFPLLWLVLALEITCAVVVPLLLECAWAQWPRLLGLLWEKSRFLAVATCALSQFSGFGVDAMHLVSFDPTGTAYIYNGPVSGGDFRGWQPMPMSHGWSISCELVFYLLAPALVRLRLPWLIVVAVSPSLLDLLLSRGLRLTAFADVASSFLAPCQFGYFALGIIAYRLYRHPSWNPSAANSLAQAGIVAGFTSVCLFYSAWNKLSYTGSLVLLYAGVVLAIPVLFARCSRLAWDREIGDLSYPVYLIHVSVIRFFDLPALAGHLGEGFHGSLLHCGVVGLASITLSWMILRKIDQRIDAFRQARLARAMAA